MSDRPASVPLTLLLILVLTGFAGCGSDDDAASLGSSACNNTCMSYPQQWHTSCPSGQRCIEFLNSCPSAVTLSYQIGCDKDGNPGAPTCNCTLGPTIAMGQSAHWVITDVDDSSSCVPKISPTCLTSGLAVISNTSPDLNCNSGTRIEFTAGNLADPFGKFDTYNIDVEKDWYSIPLEFSPDLTCAIDHGLDCRPLYCNTANCPDAFIDPTMGGCSDNRSPAAACQDTFNDPAGFIVEYCPGNCSTTGGSCPSCQMSTACS